MTEGVKLQRRVKLWQAIAIVIGPVVGSAIYISPGIVLSGSGSVGMAMVLWLFAGVNAFLGSLCFAELGTTFPKSGEKQYYLEKMYGSSIAFSYMVVFVFVTRPGLNAIKCITFGQYLLQLVFPNCHTPDEAVRVLAVIMAVSVAVMNVTHIEWSNRGQALFAYISLVALLMFSIIGLVYLANGETESWTDAFDGTSDNPGEIIVSCYAAIFAYAGWYGLNFLVEEVKNPQRNLPIAILVALSLITTLYIFTNIAYFTVLGKEGVLTSQAVAVTFGQKVFPVMAWIVPVAVATTTVSSFNAGILMSSRSTFVAARMGHLPRFLGLITTWSYSPVTSLILQSILAASGVLIFSLRNLIRNIIFLVLVFDVLTIAGLLKMRLTQKHLHRPFKVPLAVIIIYLVGQLFLLSVPLITKPLETSLWAVLTLGFSLVIHYIFCVRKWRPHVLGQCLDGILVFMQKLFVCVPED